MSDIPITSLLAKEVQLKAIDAAGNGHKAGYACASDFGIYERTVFLEVGVLGKPAIDGLSYVDKPSHIRMTPKETVELIKRLIKIVEKMDPKELNDLALTRSTSTDATPKPRKVTVA